MTPHQAPARETARPDCPVLVAGGGPVGLLIALELAHHGVGCVLADRSAAPTKFPKMDITNGRSMELFRRLGIAELLRKSGVAPQHSFDVLFALPDGEPPVGRWALPSVEAQRARFKARNDGSMPLEADQRAPQSAFEAMGRELCRNNPLIDFREGWAFEAFAQDAQGVDVTLAEAASGQRAMLRADYLVGADGAGSRVRRQLGIGLEDAGGMPEVYMVHFRSRDRAALHRYGQFWHYFVMGSVIIAQDEDETWTFHAPLIEPLAEGAAPDPAALIAERTGLRPRIDEVLLTSRWQPRFALADSYRRGRVFLAGDAVHQVFPVGGYGMNTGVGDAIDIGWKLAAVANGWGGPRLLDSYEAERRPVAHTNRAYARRHLDVHMKFVGMVQSGASRAALGQFVDANRGENEFDGIEFGYRYTGSPVVAHERAAAPAWSEFDYVPSTWPGARPPSVMLADGTALFDRFGKGLTLVDFSGDAGALADAAQARGIPMTHLPVHDANARQIWERDLVLVRPDQHVAWRGDTSPAAADWNGILDLVCGL